MSQRRGRHRVTRSHHSTLRMRREPRRRRSSGRPARPDQRSARRVVSPAVPPGSRVGTAVRAGARPGRRPRRRPRSPRPPGRHTAGRDAAAAGPLTVSPSTIARPGGCARCAGRASAARPRAPACGATSARVGGSTSSSPGDVGDQAGHEQQHAAERDEQPVGGLGVRQPAVAHRRGQRLRGPHPFAAGQQQPEHRPGQQHEQGRIRNRSTSRARRSRRSRRGGRAARTAYPSNVRAPGFVPHRAPTCCSTRCRRAPGSSSSAPTSARNREPCSPSTSRWSNDSASWHTVRTASSPSTTHGVGLIAPTARIAASPGLMIGVPVSTPNTPTLVIVNVPPTRSAGGVFPAAGGLGERAEGDGQLAQAEQGRRRGSSGTIRPRGVAAAIPSCTRSW